MFKPNDGGKIEELTLYIIKMQKEIDELKDQKNEN